MGGGTQSLPAKGGCVNPPNARRGAVGSAPRTLRTGFDLPLPTAPASYASPIRPRWRASFYLTAPACTISPLSSLYAGGAALSPCVPAKSAAGRAPPPAAPTPARTTMVLYALPTAIHTLSRTNSMHSHPTAPISSRSSPSSARVCTRRIAAQQIQEVARWVLHLLPLLLAWPHFPVFVQPVQSSQELRLRRSRFSHQRRQLPAPWPVQRARTPLTP